MYAIETDNLTKLYSRSKVKALDDFTMKLEKGNLAVRKTYKDMMQQNKRLTSHLILTRYPVQALRGC